MNEQAAGLMPQPPTPDECRRAISPIPFLRDLTVDDLRELAPLMQAREFTAGQTLFYEDDPPDAVFFIAAGAVEVFKSDSTGQKMPLLILREYGLLGEMGLLNTAPRTATARALTEVRVLAIDSQKFDAALQSGTMAAYHLVLAFSRVLSQRLSAMDQKLMLLFNHATPDARFRELDELRHRLLTSWIV